MSVFGDSATGAAAIEQLLASIEQQLAALLQTVVDNAEAAGGAIAMESTARSTGDELLGGRLDAELDARILADQRLADLISDLNALIGNTGLTIGSVTTLAAGSAATAVITGVKPNQKLSLGIPAGPQGAPGTTNEVYVSSVPTFGAVQGNDANDGLSASTPKATLAAARAIATHGCTIYMEGGSIWYGERVDWRALKNVRFRRFGQGPDPIWTGRTSLAGQAWTRPDAASQPRLWTTRVTVPQNPDQNLANPPISSGSSNVWQPALYDERDGHRRIEDCGIARYFSGVDRAACIQYVADHPGTFYCAVVGDATVNPVAPNPIIYGSQIDYWLRLADDGDPNGAFITHVDQRSIAQVGPGSTAEDLVIECTGSKDMIGVGYGLNSTPGVWRRVTIKEAAIHGGVWTGVSFQDSSFAAAYHGGPLAFNGGGVHNFRGTGAQARSRGYKHRNVRVTGFYYAFYSHGSGIYAGSTGEHDYVEIDGARVYDCASPWSFETENDIRGVKIRDMQAYNLRDSVGGFGGVNSYANNAVIVENSKFFMRPDAGNGLLSDFGATGRITYINCEVRGGSGGFPIGGSNTAANAGQYPTIELIDSVFAGTFTDGGTASRRGFNLKLTRSYFGTYIDSPNLWIAGTITADAASVIETRYSALEDLRAVYGAGIDPAVVTGVARQRLTRSITASDLSYRDLGATRQLSYDGVPLSGAAGAPGSTALLQGNAGLDSLTLGRQIRIDLGGSAYEARILNLQYGGDRILVTPAPPAAFTTRPWTSAVLNKRIFADAMAATVTIAADGGSLRLPMGISSWFAVGNVIGIVQRSPIGGIVKAVRRIAATASDVLTLDRPVRGVAYSGASYIGLDGVGGGHDLPTATIAFDFPLVDALPPRQSRASVTFIDLVLGATGDLTASSATAVFADYGNPYVSPIYLNPYRRTDGSSSYYSTGRPVLDAEAGIIDWGAGLAVGDVLTIEARVDVAAQRLAYNLAADPLMAGQTLFRSGGIEASGTEYSRRGLGYHQRRD